MGLYHMFVLSTIVAAFLGLLDSNAVYAIESPGIFLMETRSVLR